MTESRRPESVDSLKRRIRNAFGVCEPGADEMTHAVWVEMRTHLPSVRDEDLPNCLGEIMVDFLEHPEDLRDMYMVLLFLDAWDVESLDGPEDPMGHILQETACLFQGFSEEQISCVYGFLEFIHREVRDPVEFRQDEVARILEAWRRLTK